VRRSEGEGGGSHYHSVGCALPPYVAIALFRSEDHADAVDAAHEVIHSARYAMTDPDYALCAAEMHRFIAKVTGVIAATV
jgi:hypothetical protein